MKAEIQQKISPFVPKTDKNFSDSTVKKEKNAIDSNGEQKKADFRDLLFNSNKDMKLEREAKANGSFSNAKSEADYLEQLQKRNDPVRVPKNNLDKDDFLKLFVTQLQNQDPLNPDDSAEMASKLAHFNSLEQMLNVNKTLDKLLVAQNTDRQIGLVDYVGKEITVGNGRIKLTDGKVSNSSFYLSAPSAETSLQVRDAAGVLLFEKAIGSLPNGMHELNWDGKDHEGKQLGNGVYTYSISAKSMNATDIPVSISSRVKVLGVDLQDSSGSVFTDYGKVKLQDIKALGTDGFEEGAKKQASLAAQAAANENKKPNPIEQQNPLAEAQTQTKTDSQAVEQVASTAKDPVVETNVPKPKFDFNRASDPTNFIAPGIERK